MKEFLWPSLALNMLDFFFTSNGLNDFSIITESLHLQAERMWQSIY